VAARVAPGLATLLKEGKIAHSRVSRSMVLKELDAASTDLKEARDSQNRGGLKWATIQAYYSIFHSARALLYAKGYREKGHRGLLRALRELYRAELREDLLDDFEDAIGMREAADYGGVYSDEGARAVTETAEDFLDSARTILKSRLNVSREHKKLC